MQLHMLTCSQTQCDASCKTHDTHVLMLHTHTRACAQSQCDTSCNKQHQCGIRLAHLIRRRWNLVDEENRTGVGGGGLYLIRRKGALLGQEKGAIKRKLRYVIEIMGCLKCVPCLRSSIVHPLSNSLTSSLIRCCRNYPSISQACSFNIFLLRRSSYIADRAVVCSRMRHAT